MPSVLCGSKGEGGELRSATAVWMSKGWYGLHGEPKGALASEKSISVHKTETVHEL